MTMRPGTGALVRGRTRGAGILAALAGALLAVAACAPSAPTAAAPTSGAPSSAASSPAAASQAPRPSPSAAALPSSAPAAPLPSAAPAATRFRSALTSPAGIFGPLWATIDSGAFQQNGVTLEMINATTSAASAALVSNQLDGLFNSSPPLVSADAAGSDLVMVAGIVDRPLFSVWAASSITSPAQLKGKAFGCGKPGTPIELGCLMALQEMGLQPSDVSLLRLDTDQELYAALSSGQVAASVLQPPNVFLAQQHGFHQLAGIPNKPFQNIGLTVRKSRLNELRPVIPAVLKALKQGIARYKSDPAFAIATIKKYTKNNNDQLAQQTYEFYKNVGFTEDLRVDPAGIQEVIDLLSASNPKVKALHVQDLYDNSFADALAKQ